MKVLPLSFFFIDSKKINSPNIFDFLNEIMYTFFYTRYGHDMIKMLSFSRVREDDFSEFSRLAGPLRAAFTSQ
jgi:hypothetical protein